MKLNLLNTIKSTEGIPPGCVSITSDENSKELRYEIWNGIIRLNFVILQNPWYWISINLDFWYWGFFVSKCEKSWKITIKKRLKNAIFLVRIRQGAKSCCVYVLKTLKTVSKTVPTAQMSKTCKNLCELFFKLIYS